MKTKEEAIEELKRNVMLKVHKQQTSCIKFSGSKNILTNIDLIIILTLYERSE